MHSPSARLQSTSISQRGAFPGVWYPSFCPGFYSCPPGDMPRPPGPGSQGAWHSCVLWGCHCWRDRPWEASTPRALQREHTETPQLSCDRGLLAILGAGFRSGTHLEAMEGLSGNVDGGRHPWGLLLPHSSQVSPQKELVPTPGVPILWTTAQRSLQITLP